MKKYLPNITHEMKLSKYIHEVFKNDLLDTALSEFYETTKTKGFITISIDPIDYMLMSLNNSGWSSCHTLHMPGSPVSFGQWCAGIFSYMCDEVSVIAFRHSKNESEDIYINRSKIRAMNKIWRQMIYINVEEKFFICSREYPQENELTATIARQELEKLFEYKFNLDDTWKIKRGSSELKEYIKNTKINTLCADKSLHYNDIINGRNGVMIYRGNICDYENKKISVGSFPICPVCARMPLTNHNLPFCTRCQAEDILNKKGVR